MDLLAQRRLRVSVLSLMAVCAFVAPLLIVLGGKTAAQEQAPLACPALFKRLGSQQTFAAPAGELPTKLDKSGATASVIPNGRLLTPAGKSVIVAPHPFGLTVSPDGTKLVTANSGVYPFSFSVISNLDAATPTVQQVPPPIVDASTQPAIFMGLAVAPDNRTLYVSGGNDGNILGFDLVSSTRTITIDLNVAAAGRTWKDSYIGDLKLAPDGKTLWALDQANFRLVSIDLTTQPPTIAKVAPAGRYPFGLALTPDGKTAYVANVGMYQYSFVQGYDPMRSKDTWLPFPAFGQGSAEAYNGTTVGNITVPGLGDPNAPESFSVWAIDLATAQPIAKLKTGPLVNEKVNGIPAVGGSSPNSVVTDGQRVYVSNNHSDTIAVIDVATNTLVGQVPLQPVAALSNLRGVMPFGLTLGPDGKTLFVAESGINAVAVIDTQSLKVLGHIPTGWYPAKVAVAANGKQLYVANAKGFGAGPNAGPNFVPDFPDPRAAYIGVLQKGTVSLIDLPDFSTTAGSSQLTDWTQKVLQNNGLVGRYPIHLPLVVKEGQSDAATLPGNEQAAQADQPCPIQHVIFITKENRTYDEVLGDLGSVGNRAVNGSADIAAARFGQKVTPNHHALARRFAHSDNFYVDSDVSADGHRWLVGVAPNAFVETSWAASYGGKRNFRYNPDTALGRLGFTESNSALAPEDYPEAGSIWDHFERNNISFYNYGEGFEFAGIDESAGLEPTGARIPVNVPMPGPLFTRTDRNFPTFNTKISDQYRADEFARDFTTRFVNGSETLPQFTNIYFPQDHTDDPNPALGYPSTASYMADNDLALGRVVELVSKSKYWASTAIFVTEDDAQDGPDHVDAHRSILLTISPWTKRSYVSGVHSSFPSIFKTIDLFLNTPALNLYDAAASDLLDSFDFSAQPDTTPYGALAEDVTIFNPGAVKRSNFTAEELRGGTDIDDAGEILERQRKQEKTGVQGPVQPDGNTAAPKQALPDADDKPAPQASPDADDVKATP